MSSIDKVRVRKSTTRRTVLAQRDAIPEATREVLSVEIAERASSLIAERSAARVVALYAAKGSEVDTRTLAGRLVAAGCKIVYPRVIDISRVLVFHEANEAELVPGRFGLREPIPTAVQLAIDAIDVFVVPGIAFDRMGGRIGWGRGHYDATLSGAPHALRIGLAFESQLVDQAPLDVHDVRVHAVITEHATHRMTS